MEANCHIFLIYLVYRFSRHTQHCVKCVQIRSFSGLYFPAFGLNTERYEISFRIHSECGKIRTRKNSVFGHFSRSAVYHLIYSIYHFQWHFLFLKTWYNDCNALCLVFCTKNFFLPAPRFHATSQEFFDTQMSRSRRLKFFCVGTI